MINKALLETGQVDQARAGFDELLNIPQVKENGEIYWLILNDRARIAEQDNDRERAVRLYKEAIDIIESQRSSINTEANKIGFVGDKQAVYGRLIAVLFKLNQPAEAYEYIERAKARPGRSSCKQGGFRHSAIGRQAGCATSSKLPRGGK